MMITIVAALIVGAYAIAAFWASARLKEIEWLDSIPSADSDSIISGPARYAGNLFGPEDRRTPLGQKAAAFWWYVTSEARGEDPGDVIDCSNITRTNLVLVSFGKSLPIAWSAADPDDVGLASDIDSGEYGRPFSIDIGAIPTMIYNEVPSGICRRGEKYTQLSVAQGVKAEVIGCGKNGTIDRCDSFIGGVLSVPDIKSDIRHRLWSAMHSFFFPMYCALALLFLSTVALWYWGINMARENLHDSNEDGGPC